MGPPGPSAPSACHLCRSQALQSQVFPHFSTCVHSLSHPSFSCVGIDEFPEHCYFWFFSQLKDRSCPRGDSEMPCGVHGGAGAEGSEPASYRCWRCPGHSPFPRQPHEPSATTLTHQCIGGLIPPPMPPAPSELTQLPSALPDLVVRNTRPRARYCDSFPFFLNLPSVLCLDRHL